MNCRNQSGDVKNRILAFSKNGGANWDTVYLDTQLIDPVCQGSMINFTAKNGENNFFLPIWNIPLSEKI
jgi:sialidase-1